MLRQQAFKYRLTPTREQCAILERTIGVVRFIWNSALALQIYLLDHKTWTLNYEGLCRELTAARNDPELAFLSEVHSQAAQQKLKDLHGAFKDFFAKEKGFPRFKKKGRHDSFRQPQSVYVKGQHVSIPGIGLIQFRKSRDVVGKIKNATISKRGGRWYVSIQTEREVDEPKHASKSEIGIDVGIKAFAALSDGTLYESLNSFRKLEEELRQAQRKLRCKVKFSKNWKKQQAVVARIHIRIADARQDFLHKISTDISKNHAMICIEDLKVRNMSASAGGTVEDPGCRVRQKAGLNKSILDQGWYTFRCFLKYKQHWCGGRLIPVPPQYTSQTCSECLHVSAENRRTQSLFVCVSCGYTDNADVNAAKNVLRAGRVLSVCESNPKRGRKQKIGVNREVRAPLS